MDGPEVLAEAVTSGRIPGAVLAAGAGPGVPEITHVAGWAQFDQTARRPMTADTIFDLASLTKVVATLPCVLTLISREELDDPVRRYLPGFTGAGKDRVTVRQLLAHTSGLPASREYYQYLREPGRILAAALAEPLTTEPGSACAYSDVGFIVLGELCAAIAGRGLDKLARELVFEPLGMTGTLFRPGPELADRIASTEHGKTGVVHDENAEALGGVAGHAGLFSTAADLAKYAAAWAGPGGEYHAAFGYAFECETSPPARRGLGWGLRDDRWDNMGDGWPATGAGHTGFTGTSLSVDPGSGMWLVLLTNAVHFGRGPEHSVVGLRKQVHARVADVILLRTCPSQPAACPPSMRPSTRRRPCSATSGR